MTPEEIVLIKWQVSNLLVLCFESDVFIPLVLIPLGMAVLPLPPPHSGFSDPNTPPFTSQLKSGPLCFMIEYLLTFGVFDL